jgi:hypothetical protein
MGVLWYGKVQSFYGAGKVFTRVPVIVSLFAKVVSLSK